MTPWMGKGETHKIIARILIVVHEPDVLEVSTIPAHDAHESAEDTEPVEDEDVGLVAIKPCQPHAD